MRVAVALLALTAIIAPVSAKPPKWMQAPVPPTEIPSAAESPPGIAPCASEKRMIIHIGMGPDPEQQEMDKCLAQTSAAVDAVRRQIDILKAAPAEAGCLGKSAVICLATLARSLVVTSWNYTALGLEELKLPPENARDINGNPISGIITFHVFIPGAGADQRPLQADVFMSDGAHVSNVSFTLSRDPISARTEAEWRETGVFEIATAVLGPTCVGADRLAFYRQYDSALRHSGPSVTSVSDDYSNPGVSTGSFGFLHLCGASIEEGSTSGISADSGSYHSASLSFVPIPPKRTHP